MVSVRVHLNGKNRYFPTGVKVHEKYWSSRAARVKDSHDQAWEYNHLIEKKINGIREIITRLRLNEHLVSFDKIEKQHMYE